MTQKDSDQQRPGTWGSNKFIIGLAVVVLAAAIGTVVSQRGTNPADEPQHQRSEQPAPTPSPEVSADTPEVQTPSGTSKDQPSDAPKP